MKFMDLTGQRYGRLVVICRVENKGRKTQWKCVCDCGKEVFVTTDLLRKGKTKSCGCLRKETANLNSQKTKIYSNKKEQQYHNQKVRRARDKEWLYSQKQPCIKCGESRPWVIDFHHIDHKEKEFPVSSMVREKSRETILKEINKCVCLCKNCHSEFHYLYGRNPIEPVENLNEYLGRTSYEI